MLLKYSVTSSLKSCITQTIRCMSNIIISEKANEHLKTQEDLEEVSVRKPVKGILTPFSDGDLEAIHETELAEVQDMIAHKEYTDYCRTYPKERITIENQYEELNKAISPLLHIPDYYAQIRIKRQTFIKPMLQLRKALEEMNCYLRPMNHKPHFFCPMQDIRYLYCMEEYRNISQLVVNTGIDGEFNTVGYLVTNSETEKMYCINPIHNPDTKKSHKIIAMFFQDFIQNNTLELPALPWRIWKGITIRSTENKINYMAIVKVAYSISERDRLQIKEALIELFFLGELKKYCNVSSLYVQFGDSEKNLELLKGKEYLVESVSRKTYEIGPNTPFPANSKTTSLLYEAIKDSYPFDKSTVVLQIGCHSNIGMNLERVVRSVVCIEWRPSMVERGKRHMKLNYLKNVDFQTFKKYEDLTKALDDPNATYVAIVHSTNGINKNILHCLRCSPSVKAVIYIYHNFLNIKADLKTLCSTDIAPYLPLVDEIMPERFGPSGIIPIDMLPNTMNTEFVMTLKRESLMRKKPKEKMEQTDIDDFDAYQKYPKDELYEPGGRDLNMENFIDDYDN